MRRGGRGVVFVVDIFEWFGRLALAPGNAFVWDV